MNKALSIGFTAAVLVVMMTWSTAPAQGKKSDSVVTAKARLDKSPSGKAVVVVSLDIKSGWHLYANPIGNEDLESSQVVVKVADAKADIEYPAGKEVTDKILGKYKIYEDKIEIRAIVDRPAGSTGPIKLSLRVQACDEKTCLPPATMNLTVP